MKQQNRDFIDISNFKTKELFVPFFVHFLCNLSVTYIEHFLREKCFFQFEICLGQIPTILNDTHIE